MRISKSKFVAGVQCLKRVYFQVHQPELAAGSTEVTGAVVEQGRQVGLEAQKAFPGGVLVAANQEHLDEAIRVTRELVGNAEAPAIFEATFEYGGVFVRTDVLERCSRANYRLIEVKSSTGPKPHYAYDIGIQKHVLTGAGITCRFPIVVQRGRGATPLTIQDLFFGNAISIPSAPTNFVLPADLEKSLLQFGYSAPIDSLH